MRKMIALTFVVAILASLFAVPAMAQDDSNFPENTITVTATGRAYGVPDISNLQIGVRSRSENVADAFDQNNATVQNVIDALVALGVAREDIRTLNINVYQREDYPPNGEPTPIISYEVSNDLRITVRDTVGVSEVVNTAVSSGANNIYGLEFAFSDPVSLESEAYGEAMSNANAQAARLADLAGVSLGSIVVIAEGGGNFFPNPYESIAQRGMGGGGGDGMPFEPGQLSVSVQLQVTYRING